MVSSLTSEVLSLHFVFFFLVTCGYTQRDFIRYQYTTVCEVNVVNGHRSRLVAFYRQAAYRRSEGFVIVIHQDDFHIVQRAFRRQYGDQDAAVGYCIQNRISSILASLIHFHRDGRGGFSFSHTDSQVEVFACLAFVDTLGAQAHLSQQAAFGIVQDDFLNGSLTFQSQAHIAMQVFGGECGQLVTTAHGRRAIDKDVVVLPNLTFSVSVRSFHTIVVIEVSPFIQVLGRSDDVVAHILRIVRRIYDVLAGIYRGVVGIEKAGIQVDAPVLQLSLLNVGRQVLVTLFYPVRIKILRLQLLGTRIPSVRHARIGFQLYTMNSPSEVFELIVGEHTVGVRRQCTSHGIHRAVIFEAHARPCEADTVGSINLRTFRHLFGHPIEATGHVVVGVPCALGLSTFIILHQSKVGRQRNKLTLCIARIRLRRKVVISTSSK